jgi:carboxypeptidase Q
MKILNIHFLFLFFFAMTGVSPAQNQDSVMISKIFTDALTHPDSYHNLDALCHKIGGRLAGTPSSGKSLDWAENVLRGLKPDTVFRVPCKVRHWERGPKESCKVLSAKSGNRSLNVCALGGSVATSINGIRGNVIEVKDYDELKKLGRENVRGKIVFFNHPADESLFNSFAAYGGVAGYRVRGAVQAAYYGATAMIDRSATTAHDNFPHTGIMHYADTVSKIPAFSVSTNEADSLSKWLHTDPDLKVELKSLCNELPETASADVMAEIRGSEYPEEIIAFGGHLDSWDIGEGAHDDGTGVVQTIDIMRLFRSLGIKPKRTIRVVVFMDEEMEQRGAKAYAAYSLHVLNNSGNIPDDKGVSSINMPRYKAVHHVAAIEADRGGFSPWGFSIDASDEQVRKVQAWKNLLLPYGIYSLEKGGSGVDVKDLKPQGVALFGLVTDWQRYFNYHHSANDSFDKVNIRELQLGTAAMAAMVYLIDQYGL